MAQVLPLLADYMGEDIKAVMHQMNVVIPQYIQAALDHPENGRVFTDLMESKSLPESEKSMYRLSGEGFNFLLAGTETTAVRAFIATHTDFASWEHLADQNRPLLPLSPTGSLLNPSSTPV
jgi:hypothetical protein